MNLKKGSLNLLDDGCLKKFQSFTIRKNKIINTIQTIHKSIRNEKEIMEEKSINNIIEEKVKLPVFGLVPTQKDHLFKCGNKYERHTLPLISMNTTLLITPPLPYYNSILNLKFKNTSDEAVDTTLVLPKEFSSAIASANIYLGDKVLKMKLMGRQKAQDKMKKAMDEGKSAAIGELMNRNKTERIAPDVFKFRIGNLPPGITVRVEIKLVRVIEDVGHMINILK